MSVSGDQLNILIVGSGGREHALAWKLLQSSLVQKIYVAPGNGGTSKISSKIENINIQVDDFDLLVDFAVKNQINLVIPGPELPLVKGIKEHFNKVGIPCFGPSKLASQLEGSKAYSKNFMRTHNIPTAKYENFTDYESAKHYLEGLNYNVVIKASGLAAGKGVLIPESKKQALKDLKQVMVDKIFGSAGDEVVIEECLVGEEVSVLAFSDGYTVKALLPSQDHKRAYDNDQGPNTGGMGCYAPTPIATKGLMNDIQSTILEPSIKGMRLNRTPFVGILFVGIMVTSDGPKVLEYNVRFGDPETEVVLPLLKTDLAEIILACVEGRLDTIDLEFHEGSAATVIIAAGGYPNSYEKNTPITIDTIPENVTIFHAGTSFESDQLISTGGRVLAVTGTGSTIQSAITIAYSAMSSIQYPGSFYRKDIGSKALNYKPSKLTYAQSGVDIDAGNLLVQNIKSIVKSTKRLGSDSDIGGFGGIFDLKCLNFKDPILVSATDGVGTKLAVAHTVGIHDTIGIDLVAMSVNDLIVQGAEPLFFLDYFACGKLDVQTTVDVVKGVADGCIDAQCALVGGETAEMPGLYAPGEYDLGGFAVGAVERNLILPAKDIESGDLLIGLTSSGPHSNGYSLLRKIVQLSGLSYSSPCPFITPTPQTLGQALLTPTKIYIRQLLPLVRSQLIVAMAHITGGGFLDNIPRILPGHLNAVVDASTYPLPNVFKWAKQVGNVEDLELARTFNCGIGMVLIVKPNNVKEVLDQLEQAGEKAYQIGHLKQRTDGQTGHEDQVVMLNMDKAW